MHRILVVLALFAGVFAPFDAARGQTYTVDVAGFGIGSGRVTGPGGVNCLIQSGVASGTCSGTYTDGTSNTFVATAEPGSVFMEWAGQCLPSLNQCTVSRAGSVHAGFGAATLTVVPQGPGSGRITSSPAGIDCRWTPAGTTGTCTASYPPREFSGIRFFDLTATADDGSVFEGWTNTCSSPQSATTCRVYNSLTSQAGGVFVTTAEKPLLQITMSGTGAGTVTSTPAGISCTLNNGIATGTCSANFNADSEVRLRAVPASSSALSGWSGACLPAGDECVVNMAQSRLVGVSFERVFTVYTVDVGGFGVGSGRVTGPDGLDCHIQAGVASGTCSKQYSDSVPVVINATPDAGSVFVQWTGQCVPSGASCTLHHGGSVRAGFGSQTLTIVPQGSGSGRITSSPAGIDCRWTPTGTTGTCSAPYPANGAFTLTATADNGSVFERWTSSCSFASNPATTCEVRNTTHREMGAVFLTDSEFPVLQLSLDGLGNGTIFSSPGGIACTLRNGLASGTCSAHFHADSEVRLSAVPEDEASAFGSWRGPCVPSGDECVVWMSQSRLVQVVFDRSSLAYTLTVTGSGSGSGRVTAAGLDCVIQASVATGTCSVAYPAGSSVTLTATADPGSLLHSWMGACVPSGASCTAAMNDHRAVRVRFDASSAMLLQPPSTLTTERIADAVLRRVRLTAEEAQTVDAIGNKNGRVDLGDLVAWRRFIATNRPTINR